MKNWPEELPMKRVECQEVQVWTFSALVGAFLDLAIAYLLLCASTAAYLAAKFLSIFRLSLPCPCNGLFGFPESKCTQRVLVDGPLGKISSVQTSVKTKFPFDSTWVHGESSETKLNHAEEQILEKKNFEQGAEASYSSYSNDGGEDLSAREYVLRNDKRRTSSLKRRLGLRQRRRTAAVYEKSPLSSSRDPLQPDALDVASSSSKSASRSDEEDIQASLGHSVSDSNDIQCDRDTSKDSTSIELVSEKLRRVWPGNISSLGNEEDAIKLLEKALEEEHAARVALNLELEKERNAAATATDEAMAMILRLQEEKASIEMEAKHYQRAIEDKSEYDAEEMNILKEILIRREREKHFLEKELELYKQVIFANEQSVLDSDLQSTASIHGKGVSSLYSADNLEYIIKSIDKNKVQEGNPSPIFDIASDASGISRQGSGILPIGAMDKDGSNMGQGYIQGVDLYKLHFQEGKNEESAEDNGLHFIQGNSMPQTVDESLGCHEKIIMPIGDKQDQDGKQFLSEGFASNFHGETKAMLPTNGGNKEKKESTNGESKELGDTAFDAEVIVHDVHVSGDEPSSCNIASVTLDVPTGSTNKSGGIARIGLEMNRSSSDVSFGLPPTGGVQGKGLPSNFRRNSMSAVDYERMKIDNEVELLMERLKAVRMGKQKLKLSGGDADGGKTQLQLLQDIAMQLREIKRWTNPGRTEPHASLPPSSSKVKARSRKASRSASLGVPSST